MRLSSHHISRMEAAMLPFGEVLRSLAAGGTSWSLLRQLREEQMEADVLLGQGV